MPLSSRSAQCNLWATCLGKVQMHAGFVPCTRERAAITEPPCDAQMWPDNDIFFFYETHIPRGDHDEWRHSTKLLCRNMRGRTPITFNRSGWVDERLHTRQRYIIAICLIPFLRCCLATPTTKRAGPTCLYAGIGPFFLLHGSPDAISSHKRDWRNPTGLLVA